MSARGSTAICAVVALGLILPACLGLSPGAAATVRLAHGELPRFEDDLQLSGMTKALLRQRAAPYETADDIVLDGTRYSAEHVRRSRERFYELVLQVEHCLGDAARGRARTTCFDAFQRALADEFAVYTPRTLGRFTAYYTPTIEVSRTPSAEFRFPIYGLPDSDRLRQLPRRDIDFNGALAGRGLELFYARSRFDVYVLHVEGGGRVRYRSNGTVQTAYVSYADDNGRPVRLIHEHMLEQGLLSRADMSRFAQRKYLERHPEQAEEIYASCPWYVFFRETQQPVTGSGGTSLTPNRSLASDPEYYPLKGLITFVSVPLPRLPQRPVPLESNPPDVRYRHMRRFFLDQDEGPYIKGSARFDLFFGEDRYAKFLANNLDALGRIYFLVLKHRSGDG